MSARHYFFRLYREEINIRNVCKSVAASGGARYCHNAFRVESDPTDNGHCCDGQATADP